MSHETIWSIFFASVMAIMAVGNLVSINIIHSLKQKLKAKEKECDESEGKRMKLMDDNVNLVMKIGELNANHTNLRKVAEHNSEIHKLNRKEFEKRRMSAPVKIIFWLAFLQSV